MTLHDRNSIRDHLEDSIFAGQDLAKAMPKYRFPTNEIAPDDAFQAVHDELMLDGNSRQNLATFCQTWEEPEVLALMALSINKNMIDRDEYPQTAEIERRCVHMMADLWNAPQAANTVGASAIGSSEACMLAGMAAKWRWRAKRRAAGKSTEAPNMVCGPVQVVWHKFARYWDIEIREVPMSPGHYAMDPAAPESDAANFDYPDFAAASAAGAVDALAGAGVIDVQLGRMPKPPATPLADWQVETLSRWAQNPR